MHNTTTLILEMTFKVDVFDQTLSINLLNTTIFASTHFKEMESYLLVFKPVYFVYYSELEYYFIHSVNALCALVFIVLIFLIVPLFYGNSLIKLWNFLFYI
jgi:hypothetical protein